MCLETNTKALCCLVKFCATVNVAGGTILKTLMGKHPLDVSSFSASWGLAGLVVASH